VLSYTGVAAERAARLRALVDVGWAVSIEHSLDEDTSLCVIEGHGRRVIGRGADADAAAADALARLADPEDRGGE
jgi:hypothetical protein